MDRHSIFSALFRMFCIFRGKAKETAMTKKVLKILLISVALGCVFSGLALGACDSKATDEHEHVYGDWTLSAAATCEENGLRTRVCLVCNRSEEEEIPALGHNWDSGTETKAATCTQTGERTKTCRRCQKQQVFDIPTVAHNWDAGTVQRTATCQVEGELLLTCVVCSTQQTVVLEKEAHNYRVLSAKEATCEEEGLQNLECTVCGDTVTETLPALGHRWVAGKTDREATCTEPGYRDRSCLRCPKTEKTEIPALGHNFEGEFTVDKLPTFESEGSKSYHCTRCGAHGSETVIPKLDANTPIDYEFRVMRNNGDRISDPNLVITVFDGDVQVAQSSRSTLINGVFTANLYPKTYTVTVTNLPDGYTAEPTTAEAGNPYCDLYLTVAPIATPADRTTRYSIGSVMHDFVLSASMTTTGREYRLSDLLKTKKAVVLNFWATWCNPCQREFPDINEVYLQLRDEIEILAIDQSTSDNVQSVKQFAATHGLSFPMAFDLTNRLQSMFGASSIPTTVVIDGEGVVCEIHTGVFNSEDDFRSMLAPYLADNYWKAGERAKAATVRADCLECVLPGKRERD